MGTTYELRDKYEVSTLYVWSMCGVCVEYVWSTCGVSISNIFRIITSSSSLVNLRLLVRISRREVRPAILSESVEYGTLYRIDADLRLSDLDDRIASIAKMIRAS